MKLTENTTNSLSESLVFLYKIEKPAAFFEDFLIKENGP
jgi:hypothetical protein